MSAGTLVSLPAMSVKREKSLEPSKICNFNASFRARALIAGRETSAPVALPFVPVF